MRKLSTFALTGAAVLVLAGTAYAAGRGTHVMNVALPNGGVAHIEYVGDVAPKITVQPGTPMAGDWGMAPFASEGSFDRMMADMDRQTQAMVRQAQEMARQAQTMPGAPMMAAFPTA